jgi:CheY-like chemotaxis protein
MADRDQLEQVLVNLATNARDAMPDGGVLQIETRRADLDMLSARLHGLEKAGAYAVIQVSDTGGGMDEATRGKIFEPFFTTKEVGKGTGLGLAMVFGTIRQHNGYIDVYSEVGTGTVFKIYLPLSHAAPAEQDSSPQEPVTPGGSETVLVVEDDEHVREMTASILAQFGYRVITAADGEEAVARFSENRDSVSLVILDVIMPKMNGKEVYDALRRIRPDTRALFTSGYTADILNRKVMMEEGLHLLQKPVSPGELLRKVRELLDNG